jgi:hypothetical protein
MIFGMKDFREQPDKLAQQRCYRAVMPVGDGFGLGDVGNDEGMHQRLEDRLFTREVQVDGAFRRARPDCDVFHAGGGEALLGEHIKGRIEQLGGTDFLAAARLRFCHGANLPTGQSLGCSSPCLAVKPVPPQARHFRAAPPRFLDP